MTAGIDEPDRRGRSGLDQVGRDLTGNDDVRVRDMELHGVVQRGHRLRHADGVLAGDSSGRAAESPAFAQSGRRPHRAAEERDP